MYFFLVLTGDDGGEVLGDVLDEDREGPCPVLAGFNSSKSESLLLDTYMQYSGSDTFVATGAGGSTVRMSMSASDNSDNSLSESWSVASSIKLNASSAERRFALQGITAIKGTSWGMALKYPYVNGVFDVEKTIYVVNAAFLL